MTILICWIAFLITLWSVPLLMFLSFLATGHPDLVAWAHRLADELRGDHE